MKKLVLAFKWVTLCSGGYRAAAITVFFEGTTMFARVSSKSAAFLSTLSAATAFAVAPQYQPVRLGGTNGFVDVFAQSINDAGRAAGFAVPDDYNINRQRPAVWNADGSIQLLPSDAGGNNAGAYDISNDDSVSGSIANVNTGAPYPATWAGGVPTALPSPANGGIAIESNGEFIGGQITRPDDGRSVAAYWQNRVLHVPSGIETTYSRIWDINSSGRYIGIGGEFNSSPSKAFVGMGESAQVVQIPGINVNRLYHINESQLAVGQATTGNTARGLVLNAENPAEYRLLNPLSGDNTSIARDINNDGVVVGESEAPAHSIVVLYNPGSVDAISLESLVPGNSDHFSYVVDINNHDQILAVGTIGGVGGWYLLTPVPEPEIATILAAGIAIAASSRRRT